MNAGSFHQPVAVLHSGRTCQIQGTQQKTSYAQIASSLTTLALLLPIWYFRRMFSKCCCASGVQLLFGEMTGRLVRHQIPLTIGHLDTLEVSEISTSFFPCFQPTGSQPGNKCKAGGTPGQTFSSLFAHILFTVLVAEERDCVCSSKLYASSVRLSPLRMETLHLRVDVCGGSAHH